MCSDLAQFAISTQWSQLCERGRNESVVFVGLRLEFRGKN